MTEVQDALDFSHRPSAGEVLARIRENSRNSTEKGRWFERLFMQVALQEPEFEVDKIWRWADWPMREELDGRHGGDPGIDLVAQHTSGDWIAIQCKCHDERHRLRREGIDKFLGGSQNPIYRVRWIVATCDWTQNAVNAIRRAHPRVGQIDFRKYLDVRVEQRVTSPEKYEPYDLQSEAIDGVVHGLKNHGRGKLIMACGTGKTFVSLRIAEQIVRDGGSILFTAPSIALVSQARREWLRQTVRKLRCVVVCSDRTAGGRDEENEDIGAYELECPVTTDPAEIARSLAKTAFTCVVFCTYQSLDKIISAQVNFGLPAFDLAIADEAHQTTGWINKKGEKRQSGFIDFHDNNLLAAKKRLYMTATPCLYTKGSKKRAKGKGLEIIDMNDRDVYGGEFYRLSFKNAVSAKRLSDYRVIALGIHHECVPPGLLRWLKESENKTSMLPSISDMARVLGVSLAVNGVSEGSALERPGRLYRTLAFANTIARSEWYMDALKNPQVLGATTRRMGDDAKAMSVTATHLDASSSALERNRELRELSKAEKSGACRILGNVRLFTEGVDVPSLDAVAFLDPRDSQVDVVQAVGRVMRKADGKRFGYIIIPLVIPPGQDIVQALESGTEGYDTIGRVLRALQAHDSRLAESPTDFIMAYEIEPKPPGNGNGKPGEIQLELDFQECEQAIYAHVVAASGLGKPGQTVADEIVSVVQGIGGVLQREADVKQLARALLIAETDDAGKAISTIAALMLCNACLLHRRLRSEKVIQDIPDLGLVSGAESPREVLVPAWKEILSRDYKPVFRPALAVLEVLPPSRAIDDSIRTLSECANGVGDSLSDLGYDHAGPLYHRILGSAKSDGAFYTNNLSAVMLSRLAFTDDFIDWSDPEAVASLRIMDPACGSGTLLMAVLQTIKYRVAEHTKEGNVWEPDELHRYLVEDVFCGLDINPHAVQLAACNMTLGAPTVDYNRMNLATLPHGPQEEGGARAGSLDILTRNEDDLASLFPNERSLKGLGADQVNEGTDIHFPLHNLDAVIMNPPFTANENRSKKYGDGGRKAMQARELAIKKQLGLRDPGAGSCITANSIGTFFNPLADQFIRDSKGVLAIVIPTTACTGAGATASRKFLSERFHIETIVTSHDPRRPNFSENTGIHESLLICRRRTEGMLSRPSHFIALRRMPKTPEEAINVAKMMYPSEQPPYKLSGGIRWYGGFVPS